jgi:ubiquinone/menaquinone biosynthesis C-methylase UbiE
MNWKVKALTQNVVSLFPSDVSYRIYYQIQRRLGALRSLDTVTDLKFAFNIVRGIEGEGQEVEGKVFAEVGTGRRVNIPTALWLCGAAKVITVDSNPYLRPELVVRDLDFIRNNKTQVQELFGRRAYRRSFQERFERLTRRRLSTDELLELAQIEYLAPADARRLPVADNSIDYHISNDTFEHIPPDVLQAILDEGRRKVKDDGLLVHMVDFSDHFAHSDPNISTVNFLQFSEEQWRKYAGNRYMYHNRLRIDEFVEMLKAAGLEVISQKVKVDPEALRQLEAGLKLDRRFAGKRKEVNAASNALLIARKESFVCEARAVTSGRSGRHYGSQ